MLGGVTAIFCMAIIGEQYLFRRLPLYKLLLAAAAIVLSMHPAWISQPIAIAIALYVLGSEYYAQPGRRLPWQSRGTQP